MNNPIERRPVGQECCCLILVAQAIIATANKIKELSEKGDARGAFLALASLREEAASFTRGSIISMMKDGE